jgi:hypothetical protein
MTYEVDVRGYLKIIKTPTKELSQDWEDFKIRPRKNVAYIRLEGRTPWYNDVVAKLYVLGHFYEGKLKGKGEDGESYEITLPISKEDIILRASERKMWEPDFCVYQKDFLVTDRFFDELERIGFENLYPGWLKKIKKEYSPFY